MKINNQIQGRKPWRLVQIIFFFLTVIFILRFVLNNYPTLSALEFKYDWWKLSVAFIVSIISLIAIVFKNKYVYELELYSLDLVKVAKSVAKANLYRYIPGGIWNHAGLIIDLSEEGHITLQKSSKLQIISIFLNVYLGFFFAALFLPSPWQYVYSVFFLFGLFLTDPVFRFLSAAWNLVMPRKIDFPRVPLMSLWKITLANLIFWVLIGLSFVLFVQGVGLLSNETFFQDVYIGSSYILSWLAGFLFLPAPNGLGVRELVMGYLLEKVNISLTFGVSMSLLYRVFLLVRDILIFVLAQLLKSPGKRSY